jgi:hypothetical protein
MSLLQATLQRIEAEAAANSAAALEHQSEISLLEEICAKIATCGTAPFQVVSLSGGNCILFLSCWSQDQADAVVSWACSVGAVLMFKRIEHGSFTNYIYSLRHDGKSVEVRCMADTAELRMPAEEVAA